MQYSHDGDQFVIQDFLFHTDGKNSDISTEEAIYYIIIREVSEMNSSRMRQNSEE